MPNAYSNRQSNLCNLLTITGALYIYISSSRTKPDFLTSRTIIRFRRTALILVSLFSRVLHRFDRTYMYFDPSINGRNPTYYFLIHNTRFTILLFLVCMRLKRARLPITASQCQPRDRITYTYFIPFETRGGNSRIVKSE